VSDANRASTDEPRPGAEPGRVGNDRIADLSIQGQPRGFSPPHRILATWWQRSRDTVWTAVLGISLFLLGAGIAAVRGGGAADTAPARVLEQLRQTEDALIARQGELELARLELDRLSSIMDQSRYHRIPADLSAAIYDMAVSEGVDPSLAYSLVRVESGFSQHAVSSAGAVGLAQLMPSTASWLQPGLPRDALFERDTNLRLGFRYLRLMLEQYGGDLHLALLAYNRGPARVDGILRTGGDPSNGYSRIVRAGALGPSE
jgi:soluble lytic murein transglycosylase-like protein